MIAVPADTIRASLLEWLKEFWKLDHESAIGLGRRPLKDKAREVTSEILKTILDVHPLRPIVTHVLHDITDHAEAIDVLGKNKTTLLHVRHVEEVYTVVKYLVAQSDRYNEFSWRWDNFKNIHAIRNRIVNLKQELDPRMKEWIFKNIEHMKSYFHKKFEEDPTKCIEQWEKLSNWLYPISLNEIFEKAGRLESYRSVAYDWNSQTVHLSPLSDVYIGYELEHYDYGDFAVHSVITFIHKMCSECQHLVARQDDLRKYYGRQVLLETYRLLCDKPDYYMYLANKRPMYAAFTNTVLKKPHDFDALLAASIGSPAKDPLLLKF